MMSLLNVAFPYLVIPNFSSVPLKSLPFCFSFVILTVFITTVQFIGWLFCWFLCTQDNFKKIVDRFGPSFQGRYTLDMKSD